MEFAAAGQAQSLTLHLDSLPVKKHILVLGAGFGGLELTTMLSEAFGDGIAVTLIDQSYAFYFGFSKLDVMFGRTAPDAVLLPYRKVLKPGVRFLQETITAIDPVARRVRVDIDFSNPDEPTGTFHEPSVAMRADKDLFGSSRRARWFG